MGNLGECPGVFEQKGTLNFGLHRNTTQDLTHSLDIILVRLKLNMELPGFHPTTVLSNWSKIKVVSMEVRSHD